MTRSRSIVASASPGSNFGTRVRTAPTRIEAFIATVWPKVWKSGSAPSTTSPASIRNVVREMISEFSSRLRWASAAPFGLPVVPEV